jgi:hypothetical protein
MRENLLELLVPVITIWSVTRDNLSLFKETN